MRFSLGSVNKEIVGQIERGLCVLVGVSQSDDDGDLDYIARKILQLRLFDDDKGKPWSHPVTKMEYGLLVISQFTLYARLKGNKPDYHLSAPAPVAQPLFDKLVARLRADYAADKVGRRQAFWPTMWLTGWLFH